MRISDDDNQKTLQEKYMNNEIQKYLSDRTILQITDDIHIFLFSVDNDRKTLLSSIDKL